MIFTVLGYMAEMRDQGVETVAKDAGEHHISLSFARISIQISVN